MAMAMAMAKWVLARRIQPGRVEGMAALDSVICSSGQEEPGTAIHGARQEGSEA